MGARADVRGRFRSLSYISAALWLLSRAQISWRSGRKLTLVLGHRRRISEWQMWLQHCVPKSIKPATPSLNLTVWKSFIVAFTAPPPYLIAHILAFPFATPSSSFYPHPPGRAPTILPSNFPPVLYLEPLVSGWAVGEVILFEACSLAFVLGENNWLF